MFLRRPINPTTRQPAQRRGLGCGSCGGGCARGLAGVVEQDDPGRIAWTRRLENATALARVRVPVSESDGEITRQVMREQAVSVPAVRVIANENPAFVEVFPLASALESLGAPPRFIGNRNSSKFYYVDAWPIAQATAFGRWSLAVEAFERKRVEFALAKTPQGAAAYVGNYTTGPIPPDLNQAQYSNDAAALQAFLDGVFVYVQGPLIDPTPEVLARYDRAAGYPVPVTFTNPTIRGQVVAAGLRPASIPLVAQADALNAQAVQAAIVPAGTQQAAQAAYALIQANQANQTTTTTPRPQSSASAPTAAPSVAPAAPVASSAAGASVTAPAAFFNNTNAAGSATSRTTSQAAAGFAERSGSATVTPQPNQGAAAGSGLGLALLIGAGLLLALGS